MTLASTLKFSSLLLISTVISLTATSQTITVTTKATLPGVINESSGVEMLDKNHIWSHNDSGGKAELYEIDSTGKLLRTLKINGATNTDWEDVAIDDSSNIYIGDFGNNSNNRTNLKIYKVAKLNTITGTDATPGVINFSYPDQKAYPPSASRQNFDMEAIIAFHDSLYLFSKNRTVPYTGYTKLYRLPSQPGTHVAQLIDSFFTGGSTMTDTYITSADISPDHSQIMLLTNKQCWLFSGFTGRDFFGGSVQPFIFPGTVTQKEAICFINNNQLYLTDELVSSLGGKLYVVTINRAAINATITVTPGSTICPDATVTLQANAGAYNYNWSTGATTSGISGVTAGTYSVTVSNAFSSGTASATITQAACNTPTGILAGTITTNSAKISWSVQSCAFNTQLQYRQTGTATWTTVGITAPTATRSLTGLLPGTKYEYQLRTKCSATSNIYSAWSALLSFTTLGACDPPATITASNLKQTKATLTWTAAAGAYSYKLRTRVQGTSTWTNRTILAPTVTKALSGLTRNTTYEYQIQTVCHSSGTPASAYSAVQTFKTALRMEEESSMGIENSFTFYPNPTSEQLTVTTGELPEGSELIVTDMLGRAIITQRITHSSERINVSGLTAGVYFLTLKTTEGNTVRKFIKE